MKQRFLAMMNHSEPFLILFVFFILSSSTIVLSLSFLSLLNCYSIHVNFSATIYIYIFRFFTAMMKILYDDIYI